MARKPKQEPAEAAPVAREGGLLEVTVTVSGQVSNGRGGDFEAGEVIAVTPAQAASLRRQGFAK